MKFELNPNNQVCSEVQRRLGEYIDNTLSGREVWDIERHLAACTECNMVLAQTTHTITLLQHADQLQINFWQFAIRINIKF